MTLVDNPVPPARPALVAAAVRRASKQPSRKVRAKKTRRKWSVGPTFIPGVDGVTFEDFTPEMQGAHPGSFAADTKRPVIYRAPGQPRDPSALAHEMGHLVSRYATDEDKRNFMGIMGFDPNGEWNPGTGQTAEGLRSPNEFFADYYASVATGVDPKNQSLGIYAHDIDRKKLRKFAQALAQFGRYNQLSAYKEPSWR